MPHMPYWGLTSAEIPNTVKVWESRETAIALAVTVDQCSMPLSTPSPIVPGKALSTEICNGMSTGIVSYFASLG